VALGIWEGVRLGAGLTVRLGVIMFCGSLLGNRDSRMGIRGWRSRRDTGVERICWEDMGSKRRLACG